MPKVDRSLIDSVFNAKFVRGTIIRFYMPCDDPDRDFRYKFGIILNKNVGEPDALLAITTTKIEKYASGFFENDIVRITTGTYPCFVEPTIVSLREIRSELIETLKALYGNGQMGFEGTMIDADMIAIDNKIEKSLLIELNTKKRIL